MLFPYLRRYYRSLSIEDKAYFRKLRGMLFFVPKNIAYYKIAFTHASCGMKDKKKLQNNERLEFLGDAILTAVVSDYLYHAFPNEREGFLTQVRSKYVSRITLCKFAKEIGLQNFICYHSRNIDIEDSSILGNAFEAFIGAIYLDKGYHFTQKYIIKYIIEVHQPSEMIELEVDYKSKLIDYCQKNKIGYFFNTVEKRESHTQIYHTFLMMNGQCVGYGKERNKKASEQQASKHALSDIGYEQSNDYNTHTD